ncbi:MAG: DNA topoisomerase I [Chloroflexi bacterium RBG_16_68_14]|nr:MAG: DNA topoisomerase I [Chloroflexi bacterium RBG_16_68_14]
MRQSVAKANKGNKKKRLVIVESPAKARTLAGILGPEYDIRASIGHVRDLPKSRLGVDVDSGFAPRYVVPKEKRAVVQEIRKAADQADAIYLATDPDREGEAISWHLVEAAELGDRPHQRVVFHEITPEAVGEAFRHPRPIDYRLVDAQQARRVLDRLVGYQVSPLLWKKIRRGLSAGRVQSVALRMVVEREREIQGFVPREYWTIDVDLQKVGADDGTFTARLVGPAGKKKQEIPDREEAERLVALLRSASYRVADLKQRPQSRRPGPPFTTSTLQQEASRRLGFSAKRTMAVAQQLYEGLALPGQGVVGLITYMRTDSTHVAESAKREARAYIAQRFGADFVPPAPRTYRTKGKRAQEAHEAIRPTSVLRAPASLRGILSRDQLRLYTLIWQRFVACQMADAVLDLTTVEVEAQPADSSHPLLLRASESVLRFPGYRQLYHEMRDDEEEEEPEGRGLPRLAPGDALRPLDLRPEQHFTEPPPRYTEASLVKALEENGIGRPSTYAPILSTIQERGYVHRDGRTLLPQELGFVVNDLLVRHFPDVFSVGFTAEMEEELDEVARGERPWEPVVRQFYDPLEAALEVAAAAPRVEELTEETCDKCGRPMVARWGRYGRFLACTGFPECRSTRPLDKEEAGPQPTDETCHLCGTPMMLRDGPYGRFLACSRYPECKGTRPLLRKVGVACPRCRGDLVERRTRRRRIFYGCANYPQCDFTSWSRPLPQPCSHCGGLLVVAGRARRDDRTGARCTGCDWRGAVSEPELAAATA